MQSKVCYTHSHVLLAYLVKLAAYYCYDNYYYYSLLKKQQQLKPAFADWLGLGGLSWSPSLAKLVFSWIQLVGQLVPKPNQLDILIKIFI